MKTALVDSWNRTKAIFANIFGTVFGVEPPSWADVKTMLTNAWDKTKSIFANIFDTVFGVNPPASWEDVRTAISNWWRDNYDHFTGLLNTTLGIHIPTWDEVSAEWDTFCQNLYDNLPGWLKDILNFFGIGGGDGQSAETILSTAANSLADSVNSASSSISSLSGAAASAAEHIASHFTGESGASHAGVGGKFAGGAWNVPFNNYIAQLHAGEMVLTADQARRYRAQAAAGNTYNDSASIYIDKYNQYSGADADALLAQMQAMQRRRRMGYGLA